MHKEMRKKSPYDHSKAPLLKGDIKFYDTKKDGKKQKKTKPIASITDAFSCYAIYPQAKSLIDASTLIKIEGSITIHSEPPSSTEGFIFLMPEVPPAVTGFEMLLRFLFPTWDTFGLYGRPGRLVASVLDPRSLMFAMPKHRRYGYLEILDVTTLIASDGSTSWTERDWKKKLKELTGQRMNAVEDAPPRSTSRGGGKRLSIGPSPPNGGTRARVGFTEAGTVNRASRSFSTGTPGPRTDSAPPGDRARPTLLADAKGHQRNSSDTGLRPNGLDGFAPHLSNERNAGAIPSRGETPARFANDLASTPERVSSEDEVSGTPPPMQDLQNMHSLTSPEPVQAPPAFAHSQARPQRPDRAYHNAELRRATSRLSMATMSQLGVALETDTDPALMEGNAGRRSGEDSASSTSGRTDPRNLAVHTNASASPVGMYANQNGSRQALTPGNNMAPQRSPGLPPQQMSLEQKRSRSPMTQAPGQAGPQGGGQRPPGPNAYGPGGPGGREQYPQGGQGAYGGRGGGAPTPPPHGGPQGSRGPPPQGYGRGRGNPPGPYGEERRPSPGPGGAQNPYPNYQAAGNNGPPPNSRKTPPPGAQRKPVPEHTRSSPSITRKPLPQRNESLQSSTSSPGKGQTTGNFRNPTIDEPAFQLVSSPEASRRDYDYVQHQQRQRQMTMRSEASSNYDDAASSTASPDYASTRKSSETQESVERPRAGVLKTVGNKAPSDAGSRADMPDMSFGPTLNLAHPRNQGRGPWAPPNPPAAQPDRPYSPGGARKPTLTTPNVNMTPSAGEIGQIGHVRTESDDTLKRRSVAWQPGVAIGGGGGQRALSPEEFVQQRAAASNAQYAHKRTPSGNTLAQVPPLKRTGSQDYLTKRHSRATSAELLQRRNSQDSTYLLGASGTGAISSTLSAREQEQVARATGTPLIGMATNNGPGPQAQAPGLIGVMDAREREKAQMKGYNSQTVQHAINQRQQQQQYAQQQQQYAQQQMYGAGGQNPSMGNLSNMGGHMGMGPPPPSTYGGSMGGMQNMPMGRASPGPARSATLSPPPVGLAGGMAPNNMMGPRSQSPGPRFKSPPPMHGVGQQQYPLQSPGFGGPSPGFGQPSPGFGGPSPGYGHPSPGGYGAPSPGGFGAPSPGGYGAPSPGFGGPRRTNSPGPSAGPMRMASPGPGNMGGQMRTASPGPGMGPMRMASPGPGMHQHQQQLRTASPGPGQGFGNNRQMPQQPGTPRGPPPQQYSHGQAF